ncbi:MAG: MFS transporter [Beijerinckiaceae bacterium]|jgi:NNP family nitrate/nitrite transporter-like MFS transporter
MTIASPASSTAAPRILGVSTIAFTVCFAVWSIFSIIGIGIKQQLGLSETEFGLLVGTPILTGSLIRLALGVVTDRYGGRPVFVLVMLSAAIATFFLARATTYAEVLVAALGIGISGGSFAAGIAYVSRWYPRERQGTALDIFGLGNAGAAVTALVAPFVMAAAGWPMVARIWAGVLAATAVIFWFATSDDPAHQARKAAGDKGLTFAQLLAPLADARIWRFSLYYFVVFGGFVALVLWLPHFLTGAYRVNIQTAGILAACFAIPGSLFRVYGGVLSDRIGARQVMYVSLGLASLCAFLLSYPPTDYVVHGMAGDIRFGFSLGVLPFALLVFVLGFAMAIGNAAVFRHITQYYPEHVGPVGGTAGMIGGLGGFVLPIAFGLMTDLTGLWTSCFMLLFLAAAVSLLWMHLAILQMERRAHAPDVRFLAELQPGAGGLRDWNPEDPEFWAAKGRRIANRNLWISIPALLLAFAVWMVWSVVVLNLPALGFQFSPNQLFWLAALPGLSGAFLRAFYAFMVPIFGGRVWTTFSTASLLVPALGIGLAVQNPATPYPVFLALALLCGLGGGNFASSMANISFFFPKEQKGQALALNAGLGNLGVSVVQFLVPLVITLSIFGAFGGVPQVLSSGKQIWMQNAGFVWVPMIVAASLAAWFGMDDIAGARASFATQAAIFRNPHTWLLCWLYTGVFGSFIGFSAGFPLLTKTMFPGVNPVAFAFLGPLVGAAARSFSGGMADRWGGARVSIAVFLTMMGGTVGVLAAIWAGSFTGFFAAFMLLFAASGVGNASVFQMVPAIFRALHFKRGGPRAEMERASATEGAAVLGFTSAVAALGAFFIPKSFGSSIAATGSPAAALTGFIVFYVSCLAITWWFYTRRGAPARVMGHEAAPQVSPAAAG